MWAYYPVLGAGAATPYDGFNCGSITVHATDGTMTFVFAEPMSITAGGTYAVMANHQAGAPYTILIPSSKSYTGFVLTAYRTDTQAPLSTASLTSLAFSVMVYGIQ
jgi:hypothetical protein